MRAASEYVKLLRHPFWQKRRLGILDRDNFSCQKCGEMFKNLQVHHNFYDFSLFPWEYPDSALITLCELCHEKEEFMKWVLKHGKAALHKEGFPQDDITDVLNLVQRRLMSNHHEQSARDYMASIKVLMHG